MAKAQAKSQGQDEQEIHGTEGLNRGSFRDQTVEEMDRSELGINEPATKPKKIGRLTRIGLFACGGISDLFPYCTPTVLKSRSGIGWLLLTIMLFDFVATLYGWHPMTTWVGSFLIASLWITAMFNLDRNILKSTDGKEGANWLALVVRILLIIMQVFINTGLVLMITLGGTIDKKIDSQFEEKRKVVQEQIQVANQDFVDWNKNRQDEIGRATKEANDLGSKSVEEVSKGSLSGKGGGVGRITRFVDRKVASSDERLKKLHEQYSAQLPIQEKIRDDRISTLNEELEKIGSAHMKKDGVGGRMRLAFRVADEMAQEEPLTRYVFYGIELFLFLFMTSAFILKLSHRFDGYDQAYRDDIGWTERDHRKKEKAKAEEVEKREKNRRAVEQEVEDLEHAAALKERRDKAEEALGFDASQKKPSSSWWIFGRKA